MVTLTILELSSIISENTKLLHDYLTTHNLPIPSFDEDSPLGLLLPPHIVACQDIIHNAASDLKALMQGPVRLLQNASDHRSSMTLHAISRFNIASTFPVGGTARYSDIASKCNLSESDTRRILRFAMTDHIFTEPSPGVVKHTAASKALAQVPLMNQWLGMVSEEMWPAGVGFVDALEKWPGSEEGNETGFNIAFNTLLPAYLEIEKHPYRAQRFADAMRLFQSSPGMEPSHFTTSYHFFSSLSPSGTFVDVGGSHGLISISVAKTYPHMKCVVQDLPQPIQEGRANLPSELVNRVEFMEHDFLTEQPVKGADVYFFRWILHNWSDKYSIKILKNLAPALKKGARVVVNEFCLPGPGTVHLEVERTLRIFDLAMKQMTNGKERDVEDWIRLFKSADERFVFESVKVPEGSKLAIIEFSWAGDKDAIERDWELGVKSF
ncbi:putative O-methyltransferase [Tricladium varicosporioides]|nr:putative O-methyltransferase [Hymenoscyphus varicosporioides]